MSREHAWRCLREFPWATWRRVTSTTAGAPLHGRRAIEKGSFKLLESMAERLSSKQLMQKLGQKVLSSAGERAAERAAERLGEQVRRRLGKQGPVGAWASRGQWAPGRAGVEAPGQAGASGRLGKQGPVGAWASRC